MPLTHTDILWSGFYHMVDAGIGEMVPNMQQIKDLSSSLLSILDVRVQRHVPSDQSRSPCPFVTRNVKCSSESWISLCACFVFWVCGRRGQVEVWHALTSILGVWTHHCDYVCEGHIFRVKVFVCSYGQRTDSRLMCVLGFVCVSECAFLCLCA